MVSTKQKKKVSFRDVEIREYPIVLSLNPNSQYGPAIEIGWEYRPASQVSVVSLANNNKNSQKLELKEGRIAVSEYERVRPSSQRRSEQKLYLFVNQREYFVTKNGFSQEEIKQAAREKESLYLQRKRTNQLRSPVERWKEGASGAKRSKRVRRAVRNLKKAQAGTGDEDSVNSISSDAIYSGWWLPLSAYIF